MQWPLLKLDIYGSLRADGQSCQESRSNRNGTLMGGLGGGSGGTILLFLQALKLGTNSFLSVAGGRGGPVGGGGGGGGRVHFDWSNIATGHEYVQIATINGTIDTRYAFLCCIRNIKNQRMKFHSYSILYVHSIIFCCNIFIGKS